MVSETLSSGEKGEDDLHCRDRKPLCAARALDAYHLGINRTRVQTAAKLAYMRVVTIFPS